MVSLFERLGQLSPPPATKETEKPLPDQKLQQAQILLDWLIQRWDKDIVWMKDIRQFGPSALRNQKTAIDAAETLTKDGWSSPNQRAGTTRTNGGL